MSELLLGCGNSREKRLWMGDETEFTDLTTLDIDESCNPDLCYDLSERVVLDYLAREYPHHFDEIHAYEVLEHIAPQGDYKLFFWQWRTFHAMLKPGGFFFATVPHWNSIWAWGDPGHVRIISRGSLVFLDRDQYEVQVGKTPMTDYRALLGDANFGCVYQNEEPDTYSFVLQAR